MGVLVLGKRIKFNSLQRKKQFATRTGPAGRVAAGQRLKRLEALERGLLRPAFVPFRVRPYSRRQSERPHPTQPTVGHRGLAGFEGGMAGGEPPKPIGWRLRSRGCLGRVVGGTERQGGMMKFKSLLIASAAAVGLVMAAMAQQSTTMHRYAILFKYTNQAVKAMTENRKIGPLLAFGIVGRETGKHLFFFTTNGASNWTRSERIRSRSARFDVALCGQFRPGRRAFRR
jgi:hypothetical protein